MAPDETILVADLSRSINISDVNVEMNYIFTGFSAASFSTLTIILFILARGNNLIIAIPSNIGMLLFCILVTMVADLSVNFGTFFNVYNLIVILVFGILVNVFGSQLFFKSPTRHERCLDVNRSSVGIIVWAITMPLSLMEMFLAVCMIKQHHYLLASVVIAALFQKIIQAGIYYFSITHKSPMNGASFYLKIIAIFNFSMWLQSIADGNTTMNRYFLPIIKSSASVVSSVYAALLIDYRLLCFLLYIELAIEVDYWDDDSHNIEHNRHHTSTPIWNMIDFRVRASQYTGFGCLLGVAVIGVQFVNALQFSHNIPVGPWVNIFGIVADILVICQGVALIKLVSAIELGGW